MPAKPTEKQITFFLEAEDRNQFQQLCKTTGISASMVLRSWVLAALKEQRIEMNVTQKQQQQLLLELLVVVFLTES